MEEDVRTSLLGSPRTLSPKYFYDEYGSRLFDQICDTPEYYVTRTESALLQAKANDIIEAARPDHIIELGSGVSRKTRHLLDACQQQACGAEYWPYDVCEEVLRDTGSELMAEYPWLDVNALVGDYHAGFAHLPMPEGRRMYVFLGSTLGNFTQPEAIAFLRDLREHMNDGDTFLLGADRVKERDVLHAAYNDAAGITAEFNLNALRVLNRELNADFDLAAFEHFAYFNIDARQIEMHLIARQQQDISIQALDLELNFQKNEPLRTEISRKFSRQDLSELLTLGGFDEVVHYEPENAYFSLILARPV